MSTLLLDQLQIFVRVERVLQLFHDFDRLTRFSLVQASFALRFSERAEVQRQLLRSQKYLYIIIKYKWKYLLCIYLNNFARLMVFDVDRSAVGQNDHDRISASECGPVHLRYDACGRIEGAPAGRQLSSSRPEQFFGKWHAAIELIA